MVTFSKLGMPETLARACATWQSPHRVHVVARLTLVVVIMNAGHTSAKAIRGFEGLHLLFTGPGGHALLEGHTAGFVGLRGEKA